MRIDSELQTIQGSGTNARYLIAPLLLFITFFPICLCQEASGAIAPGSGKTAEAYTTLSGENSETERWAVLPLAGNNLQAVPPLLGEKTILPTFTRELIQVQWRAADPIDLYVIRPEHVAKPPVVIFLYGYPSDTDRFRNDAFCRAVVGHGFAAVGFVSALNGHRYHDRPMKEWFVSELPEALGTSVHDVQMVLNYLSTRSDLDMERVGIFGQGSGGTIAILSASVDTRIMAVDVLDPWGDWPDWIAGSPLIPDQERSTYLSSSYLESVADFDPVRVLPKFKLRALRLEQTMFSKVTPGSARDRILGSIAPPIEAIRYKDLDDYEENVNKNTKIFDWLRQQLHSVAGQN